MSAAAGGAAISHRAGSSKPLAAPCLKLGYVGGVGADALAAGIKDEEVAYVDEEGQVLAPLMEAPGTGADDELASAYGGCGRGGCGVRPGGAALPGEGLADALDELPCQARGTSAGWAERGWTEAGVWPRLHTALLTELRRASLLDLDDCSVDGSHVRALKGGTTSDPRPSIGPALARSTT